MDDVMYFDVEEDAGMGMGEEGEFTPADKKNLDLNTEARHEHVNKGVLDTITKEKVEKWDGYKEYDDTELKKELADIRLRNEREKYYGNSDIVPQWFIEEEGCCYASTYGASVFDDENKTVLLGALPEDVPYGIDATIEEFVLPYSVRYNDTDYLVTGIAESGFYDEKFHKGIFQNLKKLILPSSIKTIGANAFGETSLENQIDLRNCASIGENAFSGTVDTFAIKGCTGSAAETYAKESGINFIYLETDVGKGYVDEKVGDIETALDNIIAIKNELIGGESV